MKRWPLIPILLLGALISPLAEAAALSTDLYLADAELRVDRAGRAVLLLDRADRGEPGLVDTALVYEAPEPLPAMAPRYWQGAAIEETRTSQGRVIRIATASGAPFLLRFEVADQEGPVTEVRRIDAGGIDLRGGLALLAVGGRLLRDRGGDLEPPPSFAEAQTAHLVTTLDLNADGSQPMGTACSSGASSCSISCQGSILGVTIGDECSIDCKKGYSACCKCTGILKENASCTCTLDQRGEDELVPDLGGGSGGAK